MKRYLTGLQFWISDEKIDTWAMKRKIFFVLAMGRSGTKFLANLLNRAQGALVCHEPVKDDFGAYLEAFHDEEKAECYIQRFRKKEIYLRTVKLNVTHYGEVNGVLRRHCNALKRGFPQAIFLHLIRDGRDVVRSMISRQTMTPKDLNTGGIGPGKEDRWYDQWPSMDRFEKLCWYWAVENRYLRANINKTIKFEDAISNYEYFCKNVLDNLGLKISVEEWQGAVQSPKNVTEAFLLPSWRGWDLDLSKKFERICGQEMIENGYELG